MNGLQTIEQAAEYLAITPRQVKSLISHGRLRAVDITGNRTAGSRQRLRVPQEALHAFCRDYTVKQHGPARKRRRK